MSSQKFSFDRFSSLSFLGRVQFIRELKAHLDQAIAFRKENDLEDCTNLTAWQKECNNILDTYKARLNEWGKYPQLDLTFEQFIDLFKELEEQRYSSVKSVSTDMLILPFQSFLPELLKSADNNTNSKILLSLSKHINLAQLWGEVPNDLFCDALHIKVFNRINNHSNESDIRTEYFRTTKYIDVFGVNFNQKDFASLIETIASEDLNKNGQKRLLILIFALLVRDNYTLLNALKDEHAPLLSKVLSQIEMLKEKRYYTYMEFYANAWGDKMESVLEEAKELILSEELLEKVEFEKFNEYFTNSHNYFSEQIKAGFYKMQNLSEKNKLKAVNLIFKTAFEKIANLNEEDCKDVVEGVSYIIEDNPQIDTSRNVLNELYGKTADAFESLYLPLLDKLFKETEIDFIHNPYGAKPIYSSKSSSLKAFLNAISTLRNLSEKLNKKLNDNITQFETIALALVDIAKEMDEEKELAKKEQQKADLENEEKERKVRQKQFAKFKKELLSDVEF